ncbi:MAG: SAM-dependent methyltransferase [Flavobacteriales bacterium]|nr:SAM-dependent methyltransferase [Flavobacteriales bacterium]
MSENLRTYSKSWEDYELLDAGGGIKLERWGNIITIRPEMQAYFHSGIPYTEWRTLAHWEFVEEKGQKGKWKNLQKDSPKKWSIGYKRLKFNLELTNFKHVGLFPEQQNNWDFISSRLNEGDRFLNLFAYTGAASCIARNTGADTFHVDSSKNALAWAKSNMDESKLLNIRWVHEDALKFIQREVKRGNKFNGIVMDPPAWGIGAKGEKWKLEDKIDELMSAASEVLDEDGFLVMNTYSPMVDVTFITELSEMYFEGMKKEISELYMETKTDKFMYFGNLLRIG